MFQYRPRKVVGFQLTKRVDESDKPKYKYTNEGWDRNTRQKLQLSRAQAQLAQRLIDDSERVIEEVTEDTKEWQREVEHQLRTRQDEIAFLIGELNKQRETAVREEEALSCYRNRIIKAMSQMNTGLDVDQKCMKLRNERIGYELCIDEVERQLVQEIKIIKGCRDMMQKTLDDTTKQLQRLRSALFLLDKDIQQKFVSMRIDEKNLSLREAASNLGEGIDTSLPVCNFTLAEWTKITAQNIQTNAKELYAASELRGYIDLLLKQIIEDLQNQTERTNDAIRRRIRETREAKHTLEDKHEECGSELCKLKENIAKLEQEIKDRQRSLALCQTRLSNRARRPSLEATCDMAQDTLFAEFKNLQKNLAKLNQKLGESRGLLRYLSHTQLMQEEELNMKACTLKIDEVDCQTMREVIKYTA